MNGNGHADSEDELDDTLYDDEEEEEEPKPLPVLSGVKLYAQRQKKLRERKEKIGTLSNAVVENPEENVRTKYVIGGTLNTWVNTLIPKYCLTKALLQILT
mgnify:FL=1